MWKRFILCLAIAATLFSSTTLAQQVTANSAEALSLFKLGNFAESAQIYATLLERNDRDLTHNYYYGVCLYHLNTKTDEALRRLKFSASRPVSNDLYFYLGKLYQQIYEMELAIENFERYLKQPNLDDTKSTEAKLAIDDCRSGLRLINKCFDIKVVNKDTIHKSELLNYYHLQKDAGKIMSAADFFSTGVDPEQIIFQTERGDEVFFSIQEMDETWNIYKIVHLLDSWNEAEALGEPVNSQWNDLYPFMLTDGISLYFSSNRPGGMGGLDIYQTYYDPETRKFSSPLNLGPPFNSPADDYLLVPDVFNGSAWFTSNRGLTGDNVIVTEIIWDDSVVKNNTESINQLRTLASLPISPDLKSKSSTTLYSSREIAKNKAKNEIKFMVNDTLTYLRFDEFHSSEALEVFKNGHQIELEKDSLTLLMAAKRKAYTQSYNQNELKQLIDEIVSLEKQTYGLDELITPYYQNARRLENQKINQLVNEGEYRPKASAAKTLIKATKRSEIAKFNLKDFSFYSDDDFNRKIQELNAMYVNFFTEVQISNLSQADTTLFWANVLSLESAKVLEQTRNMPTSTINPVSQLFKNTEEEETPESIEIVELIHKSREMKRLSLDLYDEGLNAKYNIYHPVAVEFNSTSNQTGNEYMLNQASSNFRKAEEGKASIILYNSEEIERLLALKKHSVEMLEASFAMQTTGVPYQKAPASDDRFFNTPTASTPSYPLIQKGEEGISPENRPIETKPSEVIASEMDENQPEYRIQIGVFRNTPNAAALANIPTITNILVPETETRKYFSGSWSKYSEAQAMVQPIRDAGFPGAFVVAFDKGEPITLEEAKQMEAN